MGLGASATITRIRFAPLTHVRTKRSNAIRSQPLSIAPTSTARFFARRYSDDDANAGIANTSSNTNESWHLDPPTPDSPVADTPLERLKHPARGGQDLSHRYRRLERALRGKEEYERDIEENTAETAREYGEAITRSKGRREKNPFVFQGFTIPEAPKPPGPDECCMSGCAVCVHDLYAEALDAHEHALDRIRCALHDKGIDEETWPRQLRHDSGETKDAGGRERKEDLTGRELAKAKQASLSAFEQMELQLAARRALNINQEAGPHDSKNTEENVLSDNLWPMLDGERRLAKARTGRSCAVQNGYRWEVVIESWR